MKTLIRRIFQPIDRYLDKLVEDTNELIAERIRDEQ